MNFLYRKDKEEALALERARIEQREKQERKRREEHEDLRRRVMQEEEKRIKREAREKIEQRAHELLCSLVEHSGQFRTDATEKVRIAWQLAIEFEKARQYYEKETA